MKLLVLWKIFLEIAGVRFFLYTDGPCYGWEQYTKYG